MVYGNKEHGNLFKCVLLDCLFTASVYYLRLLHMSTELCSVSVRRHHWLLLLWDIDGGFSVNCTSQQYHSWYPRISCWALKYFNIDL